MVEVRVVEMLGDNLIPYGPEQFEVLPRKDEMILIGDAGADAWFFVRRVVHAAQSYSPKKRIMLFCERAEPLDGVLLDEN
jgi:hypothetical protein